MNIAALFLLATIAFVPLDDRPVTTQLPQLLGRIAGVRVQVPPPELLGHYLQPGSPQGIIEWLNQGDRRSAGAYVLSSDMLAYGGLVASRVPGVTYADARNRLNVIAKLRASRPQADIGVFGTVMRLAPTGVPALGGGEKFFAAYPVWKYLQAYANLHDPPLPSEAAVASTLRAQIGAPALQAYLDTRARNRDVDRFLVELVSQKKIDRAVLGQDDAGPVGLHIADVHALQEDVSRLGVSGEVSIEPGADELGMSMVARALARHIHWTPHIAVRYSPATGAAFNDPLEFAPISNAIDSLIGLCSGVHDDVAPDLTLFVRVPRSTAADDAALIASMQHALDTHQPALLADLTFLENSFASQAAFAKRILDNGMASRLDAYSSWNTNANTVGTALAEGIAAGAGRRAHRYDALAHAEFTFDRFVDDYAFHDFVRPDLNVWLDAHGVADHTYLLQEPASQVSDRNNALLWNDSVTLLGQLYPQYHIAAIKITLPWERTFETQIEAALAPSLPPASP